MEKVKKNLDESIYSRLKKVARQRKRPVQEILKYYAMERFLYRLSMSTHQNTFYLKGGLMLMAWNPMSHRATVDIDFLAKTSNSIENLQKIINTVCGIEVVADGVRFAPETLKLSEAQLEAEYHGVSATFSAQLFTAKLPMRIDFGFSDTILPRPAVVKYPTLLDLPAPELKGYTPQTSIAEKFESIKKRYLEEAHLHLDEVILVGHSMGGMVAGQYAVNSSSGVSVKAIVSLNTPWKGSWLADLIFNPSSKPGAAFIPDNQTSKALREKLMQKEREGSLKLFTVSSSLDPMVRPESSSLDLCPENQIFSKVQDHYSAMIDPWLAGDIRDKWIIPIPSKNLSSQ